MKVALLVLLLSSLCAATYAHSLQSLTYRVLRAASDHLSRRSDDDDMSWFDSKCYFDPDFLTASSFCTVPVGTSASQLTDDMQSAIDEECTTTPGECTPAELDQLLNNNPQVVTDMTDLVDQVCKSRGNGKTCLQMITPVIKKCIDFSKLSDGTSDGLTVDQVVISGELMCTKDSAGASCGVKMIEFSASADQVYSEASPCDLNGFCTAGCESFLTDLSNELGCCYAELKSKVAELTPDGTDVQALLPIVDQYWTICQVPEPSTTCSGKSVPTFASSSGGPAATTINPTLGPGGQTTASSSSSSGGGGSSTWVIVGAAGGGLVLLVAVVVGFIIFRRSRAARPGHYMSVNGDAINAEQMTNTDDDMEEA